jgi:hypothetical protein
VLEGASMSDDVCIMGFLDNIIDIEPKQETIPELHIMTEEEREIRYKAYYSQERFFEDKVCEVLTASGIQYERQKRIANGIIDIFVYEQPPIIIEVKREGTPFYLMQALAQLKFYEACFKGGASLFISVPWKIPEEYHHVLEDFNVRELRLELDPEKNREVFCVYGKRAIPYGRSTLFREITS